MAGPTLNTNPIPSHCPAQPTVPPPRSGLCASDVLLSVLECYMTEMIRRNERPESLDRRRVGTFDTKRTAFHASKKAPITPGDYLRRLVRYSFCSRSAFMAAFYYLQKVSTGPNATIRVTSCTIHRLLIAAVLLATKFIDDLHYSNAHFAKVGGLNVKVLNMLEMELLKHLDFRLHISAEEFTAFEARVVDSTFDTCDPEFSSLPMQLRDLGYDVKRRWAEVEPRSPTSTMAVSFATPCHTNVKY